MKNSSLIYGFQRPNDKPDLILVNSPIRDYTNEERQETEQLPAIFYRINPVPPHMVNCTP